MFEGECHIEFGSNLGKFVVYFLTTPSASTLTLWCAVCQSSTATATSTATLCCYQYLLLPHLFRQAFALLCLSCSSPPWFWFVRRTVMDWWLHTDPKKWTRVLCDEANARSTLMLLPQRHGSSTPNRWFVFSNTAATSLSRRVPFVHGGQGYKVQVLVRNKKWHHSECMKETSGFGSLRFP